MSLITPQRWRRKLSRWNWRVVWFAVVYLHIAFPLASAQEIKKVAAMYGARSGASWPLWMAKEGGYYRKYGLDVEMVFGVHPAPIAAILSGYAVMTSTGSDPGVLAVAQSNSLIFTGSFLNKGTFALVAAKSLTSIQQLGGKKIGVGRVGDPPYFFTVSLLEKFGLSAKDVQWVSTGVDAATRAAALQSGQIDAALVTAPSYFRLEAAGFRVLGLVSDYEDIYVSTYTMFRRESVVSERKLVEAFIKAQAEAIKRFYDDKPFALQTMIQYGGARDQNDAAKAYEIFAKSRSFEPIPYVLKDSVRAAVERQSQTQPQLKQFDFSKVIDNSIVDRLVKEGFFEEVFGLRFVDFSKGDRRKHSGGEKGWAMKALIHARLIVLSSILACVVPTVASAQKLVVGYSGVTAIQAPFWIIKDAGYFKQEGLDADLIYISASSTMAQAMLAGEVAISSANSQAVVDTGLQGGDLVAVGAIVNFVALYVIAAPEIKSVADLRGKPVGVSRFGATTDFGIQMFLKKYGLEPVRDVPIIQIGGLPELAAALSKKSIYAAAMSYPMGLVAQQAGMKVLANLAKEEIPFVHQGLTTTGKFMRGRRAQAKAFVRAYGRAVHFMHTRKEESKAILSRYTKVTDPSMLEGTMQYAYDFVEKIPLVKREAFQVTLDEIGKKNPKAKQAKPEQFYDNSLVQELINEGFFASLWGR